MKSARIQFTYQPAIVPGAIVKTDHGTLAVVACRVDNAVILRAIGRADHCRSGEAFTWEIGQIHKPVKFSRLEKSAIERSLRQRYSPTVRRLSHTDVDELYNLIHCDELYMKTIPARFAGLTLAELAQVDHRWIFMKPKTHREIRRGRK